MCIVAYKLKLVFVELLPLWIVFVIFSQLMANANNIFSHYCSYFKVDFVIYVANLGLLIMILEGKTGLLTI